MKACDFDNKFDQDQSVLRHLDISKANRPGCRQKRVNVDFPVWMIESLDREAKRLGVTRQSIIKVWIAERLQKT
jgi:macrodomain Ter protein organizer (MatP/YcbG family)